MLDLELDVVQELRASWRHAMILSRIICCETGWLGCSMLRCFSMVTLAD